LLGQLLVLLAHDLRNPLSALHSNIGFLESSTDGKDSDLREALADVTVSCGSLNQIIDNLELFGLSTLEEPPRLERLPVSLDDLAKEAVNRALASAGSYGAELVLVPNSSAGVRVRVHREMAIRALGNLLFNAIQHGGGGVVSVACAADGSHGVIRVSDAGLPISPNLRDNAFTAAGQISCKNDPDGRYSRGLGLFAAGVAAALSGAEVLSRQSHEGKNVLELRGQLA
jgi:two-component system sensor histidine kinase MtrB